MSIEGLGNVRFDWQNPFTTDVTAAIQKGETIVSALPKLQETYQGLAEAQGYQVSTE
jgi:hypothetical protein